MRERLVDGLDPATIKALDDIDRAEAFKGQPDVISWRLPRKRPLLENRINLLYEHLARNAADPQASAYTRARIEQADRMLNRIISRSISRRDWTFLLIGAAVGIGGVVIAYLTLMKP